MPSPRWTKPSILRPTPVWGALPECLVQEIGNWPQAAAAYHSRTEEIGATYETRVMAIWPLANQFSNSTPHRREQVISAEPDISAYTPAFAARMKQTSTDLVRLAATKGSIARPVHQQAKLAGPDCSGYTPEFATSLKEMAKEMANVGAQHAPAIAMNPTVRPPRPRRCGDGRMGRHQSRPLEDSDRRPQVIPSAPTKPTPRQNPPLGRQSTKHGTWPDMTKSEFSVLYVVGVSTAASLTGRP